MKGWNYTAIVFAVVVAVFAVVGYRANYAKAPGELQGVEINEHLPMQTVKVGDATIRVEVAATDAERTQGLSGRASLAEGSGMLFIFDPPREVGFWMKDMHFSIDMIFAAEDGTIVNIAHNATPESYPQAFPSNGAIRYVLEVPAGYAKAHAIAEGGKIVVQ